MKKLKARFKLWLNTKDAQGVFGDGKWRLLKAIQTEGSLKAASKLLGISYRKAWGDLKKAERCLRTALIDKQRGGNTGGRTVLTEQGKRWLKAYTRFRRDIERAVEEAYGKYIKGLIK
ncbi:MAG: winged helix-turn-helix domain-containing protein [Planctomycetota bacterium]|jgi:molybdate transport system regulatory protein